MKTKKLKLFRAWFAEIGGDGNQRNHEIVSVAAEHLAGATAIAYAESSETRKVLRVEAQGGEVIVAE